MNTKLAKKLASLSQAKKSTMRWITPMAAMLTKDYFSNPTWLYECKFDGERVIAYKKGSEVHLYSRNKQLLNATYPELVQAIKKQPLDSFIVDGEVVAFKHGVTSFETLAERMRLTNPEDVAKSPVKVFYYLFDIPYCDGYNVTKVPLIERKSLLKQTISFKKPLLYTEHKVEHGVAFYHQACTAGWEGIIAKNAASTYQSKRSRDWLKFKCVQAQEFVIAGYTNPRGERTGFGALLLGYYDGKTLLFAGKVGTGFDQALLQELTALMQSLERATSPFAPDDALPKKQVHWIKPVLVAQVGFEEWTKYGKLRQPRFLGLRPDKQAHDVVREDIKQLIAG